MIIDDLFFIGDVHADFKTLSKEIEFYKNSKFYKDRKILLIQVGDFGYWRSIPKFNEGLNSLSKELPDNINIYFCAGNHENHHELKMLEMTNKEQTIIQIEPNIYYCVFGSILDIEFRETSKKYSLLFCGKADSIDKHLRTPGFDWFPEESISLLDMYKLPEIHDIKHELIVVSHSCPEFLDLNLSITIESTSRIFLNQIYNYFKPKYWFFGHFHKYIELKYIDKNCYFIGIDMIYSDRNNYGQGIIEFIYK